TLSTTAYSMGGPPARALPAAASSATRVVAIIRFMVRSPLRAKRLPGTCHRAGVVRSSERGRLARTSPVRARRPRPEERARPRVLSGKHTRWHNTGKIVYTGTHNPIRCLGFPHARGPALAVNRPGGRFRRAGPPGEPAPGRGGTARDRAGVA